jgi:hypothetical protein
VTTGDGSCRGGGPCRVLDDPDAPFAPRAAELLAWPPLAPRREPARVPPDPAPRAGVFPDAELDRVRVSARFPDREPERGEAEVCPAMRSR